VPTTLPRFKKLLRVLPTQSRKTQEAAKKATEAANLATNSPSLGLTSCSPVSETPRHSKQPLRVIATEDRTHAFESFIATFLHHIDDAPAGLGRQLSEIKNATAEAQPEEEQTIIVLSPPWLPSSNHTPSASTRVSRM